MNKEFHVLWRIDISSEDHLAAAKYSQALLQEPGNTATVFEVTERGTDQIVTIDLNAEGEVIEDMRDFTASQRLQTILARINADVQLARGIAEEPFSIKIDNEIDVEIQPACTSDSRILVGRKNWGYTVVNYTAEGLIVDTYAEGVLDSARTFSLGTDDLTVQSDERVSGQYRICVPLASLLTTDQVHALVKALQVSYDDGTAGYFELNEVDGVHVVTFFREISDDFDIIKGNFDLTDTEGGDIELLVVSQLAKELALHQDESPYVQEIVAAMGVHGAEKTMARDIDEFRQAMIAEIAATILQDGANQQSTPD